MRLGSQAVRVTSNYARMVLGFGISLVIIKRLLSFDPELYGIYVLVAFGLGIGSMVRELLRASLVPLMTDRGGSDRTPDPRAISLGNTASLLMAAVVVVIGLGILSAEDVLVVPTVYRSGFAGFFLFRILAGAVFLLSLPALTTLSLQKQMGWYNLWLLLERVGDLIAVETMLSLIGDDPSMAIVMGGAVYFFWCLLQTVAVMGSVGFVRSGVAVHYRIPTEEERRRLWDQFRGHLQVIVNMALYFRGSVVLANIWLGAELTAVFGAVVQLAGYLRQAVGGAVFGSDALFVSDGRRLIRGLKRLLEKIGDLNASIALAVTLPAMLLMPEIADFFVGDLEEQAVQFFVLSGRLLTMGVLFRGLAEHWMQFLNGSGRVRVYSKRLLAIALLSPVVWVVGHQAPPAALAIAWSTFFLAAMAMSFLIVLPWVVASELGDSFLPLFIRTFRVPLIPVIFVGLLLSLGAQLSLPPELRWAIAFLLAVFGGFLSVKRLLRLKVGRVAGTNL